MQDRDEDRSDQLPALLAPGDSSLEQLVELVFDADEPLPFIQRQLDSQALGDEQRLALQSLGSFFLGGNAMLQPDFDTARGHFMAAAEGLSGLGIDELRDLAIGLGLYSDAMVAIRGKNFGLARGLLAQMEDHLRKAGKYGQRYQRLIDQIQPEALFIEAIDAALGLDIDRARLLIEQADQAAVKVATLYCETDSPEYFFWKGYAHYFKASYALYRAYQDFGEFNYDNLVRETDLDRDAIQARDLLTKAVTANPNVVKLININEGLFELLHVLVQLTPMMQRVFNGTFKPDPQSFDSLRRSIRKSTDCFSLVGADAASQLRLCDQLLARINNLERLTRPKPEALPARPRPRRPRQRPHPQ